MRIINLLLLAVAPMFCMSQNIDSTYKKWEDKGDYWIFTSYNSIKVADGDTLSVSVPYKITIPKSIRHYYENPNGALFVFSGDQYAFIRTPYNHHKTLKYDQITDEIQYILDSFNDVLKRKHYKGLYDAICKKKRVKKRITLYVDGILFVNIKSSNTKICNRIKWI